MASTISGSGRLPARAGVALGRPYLAEVVATRPRAAWLEFQPEDFSWEEPNIARLLALSADYPLSVHTARVLLDRSGRVDRVHLRRIRGLIDRIRAPLVSGHLVWGRPLTSTPPGRLALPCDETLLTLMTLQVDEVQEVLGHPFLVELPSVSASGAAESALTGAHFMSELVHRTGCLVRCDVTQLHIGAITAGCDSRTLLGALPPHALGELQLKGETREEASVRGDSVVEETRGAAISADVWRLYVYVLKRFGPTPTLIEGDHALTTFNTLLEEAVFADALADTVLTAGSGHVTR